MAAPIVASLVCSTVVLVSAAIDPEMWLAWLEFLANSSEGLDLMLGLRLAIAIAVVWFAGRTDQAWLVPFGLMLATPTVGAISVVTVLAAVPRLIGSTIRLPFGGPPGDPSLREFEGRSRGRTPVSEVPGGALAIVVAIAGFSSGNAHDCLGRARTVPDFSARPDVTRAVNVLGFTLFGCVVAILGLGVLKSSSVDLRVYHLAASHVLSDDVYLHRFPDWPFVYPPSALLLMAPMGAPLPVARILMFLLSVASVWITLHLTARSCAEGTAWARPGAVAAYSAVTLLTWPLLLGMGLGQVAPVVMGLSAIGMLGRPSRWSGAWIGTAAALKLTPALFGLHLWMVGRGAGRGNSRRHVWRVVWAVRDRHAQLGDGLPAWGGRRCR